MTVSKYENMHVQYIRVLKQDTANFLAPSNGVCQAIAFQILFPLQSSYRCINPFCDITELAIGIS